MNKYINMPEINEYEHISSYVDRLLYANGFKSYKEFAVMLGYTYIGDSFYECMDFRPLLKFLEVDDWSEFYLKTTTYQIVAFMLKKERQVSWISSNFGLQPIRKNMSVLHQYRRCPECDKKKAYTRTYHNVAGINVCYEHKCSLTEKGISIVDKITDEDIKCAEVVKKIADKKLDTDRQEVFKLIPNITIKSKAFVVLINKIISENEITSILNIKPKEVYLYNSEYEILSQSNILVEAIHKKCGTRFCTTAYGFNNGFLCPTCQGKMSNSEILQLHIDISSNGDYSFINEVKSFANKINFKHVCGDEFLLSPNKFLDGIRCQCENGWTETKVKKFISDNCPEFEFIRKEKGKYILRHSCGKTFPLTHSNFFKRFSKYKDGRAIQCPRCDSRVWDEEKVRQKIASYGFKYISEFKNTKNHLNLICPQGHKIKKMYEKFLVNPTCRICSLRKRDAGKGKDLVYKYIIEHYKKDDLIYMKNLVKVFEKKSTAKAGTRGLCEDGVLFKVSCGVYTLSPDMPLKDIVTKLYDVDGQKNYLDGAFLLSEDEQKTTTLKYEVHTSKIQQYSDRIIKGKKVYLIPLFNKYRKKKQSETTD